MLALPSIGNAVETVTAETPGIAAILLRIASIRADDALVVLDLILWNADAEGLHLRGLSEAGIDVRERAEGADHQARADQQNQSKSDLHDDENAARAVLFAASAVGAAAFANAGAEAHACVFENGDAAEEHAGENGNGEREEQARDRRCRFH